jgi:rRNA processing protein Gar1
LGRIQQSYIEIYPRWSIIHKFITEDVQYEKQKIHCLSCEAIKGTGNIIQLSHTNIPYLEDELEKSLKEALDHYGIILDIGYSQESTDGWFMSSSYVVLQREEWPLIIRTSPYHSMG